jgi:thymidylate synthase
MSGRIYNSVKEAVAEVQRELMEMGIQVGSHSYQDKIVDGNDDFVTKELQAYSFTIVSPDWREALEQVSAWYGDNVATWVRAEFEERTGFEPFNPGEAWKLRHKVWRQFIESDGRFSYTYSERMYPQLVPVVNELKTHMCTRQAIVEMHNNHDDLHNMGGKRRIPCSMFYQFLIRRGALDCIYVMRSSDFYTHFVNDLTLAIMLQNWVRDQVGGLTTGNFHMFVSSLHAFNKDLKARGIF